MRVRRRGVTGESYSLYHLQLLYEVIPGLCVYLPLLNYGTGSNVYTRNGMRFLLLE